MHIHSQKSGIFAGGMEKGQKETLTTRLISVCFTVLALAVFKPFGLDAWHWQAYAHLVAFGVIGFGVCMLTDCVLKYLLRMPRSFTNGINYIIRRNLWFQIINTPLIALTICVYRHLVLSNRVEGNRLSWTNYLETLLIFAFCSFAIGLYWRFKFRSRYLEAELEETKLLNEQLRDLQNEVNQRANAGTSDTKEHSDNAQIAEKSILPSVLTLTGSTSETVTLQIQHLLYIEAVGNYVKIYQLNEGQVRSDLLRTTSKQIEADLSGYPMIVRCHRAFLVNLQQVEQIISKSGSMQLLIKHSHESIPVSRSNVAQVKDAIKGV